MNFLTFAFSSYQRFIFLCADLRLVQAASQAFDSRSLKSDTYWSKFRELSSFERNFSFKKVHQKFQRSTHSVAKYQLNWTETKSFLNRFSSSKHEQMNAFIPIFFRVKAVWPDHSFQCLMKSFKGTLTFRMVRWRFILSNAKLMHDLLKNSRHEIWALVRLNRLWEAYKCKKNFTRAFTMFLVLIFLSGMASGKRVEHTLLWGYSWPDLLSGKGSTQSIIILLNGSSKAGIGCKWAFGIVWLGFPIIWQVWQD